MSIGGGGGARHERLQPRQVREAQGGGGGARQDRLDSEEDSLNEDLGDFDTSKDIDKYAENCKIDFDLW